MRTKHINKYILVVLLCTLTMNSCKKFLDEKPLATSEEAAVFSNPQTALLAVLGVYNQLCGDRAYGQALTIQMPFDTDEMVGWRGNAGDVQTQLNDYTLIASNGILSSVYGQLYSGVERANICIYNIPRMAMYTNGTVAQQTELKRLYGEALTLRAMFYSDIVKFWGDVPAPWEPSNTITDYNLPQTNRDVIYDRIIEDLRVASEIVPWRTATSDERITKGAVKALRARIALFRGGYSIRSESKQMERRPDYLKFYAIARDECFDIMQRPEHKLNPSFEAVFRDALGAHKIEPNGEILFEIAMFGNDADSDSKVGSVNGVAIGNTPATGGNVVYSGQGRNKILPTLFYQYSPFDKRRDVSIAPLVIVNGNFNGTPITGATVVSQGLQEGKWRRDYLSNPTVNLAGPFFGHNGLNWPLIRFSDVLLMYAEAVNEINNGPTPEAIAAVNQVRRRSWTSGAINAITVTNGGTTNYTSAPTVIITGGGGTGATAFATVVAGKVTRVDVVNPGSGYTSSPTFTFTGGAGAGASATATLTTLAEADLAAAQTAGFRAFLDAIQKERLLEFAGEAIRKYDLIRWNELGNKLAETKAELMKMEPGTLAPPYTTYPSRMFFLANSKTGLVWLNSFYAPAPTATTIAGYTAVNWLSAMTAASIRERFATGYTPNKSELLPIPLAVINTSNNLIKQNNGY